MKHLRKHLSFANVVACVALFVALGSGAYAATAMLPKKSVKTRHLAQGIVTTTKMRNGAVTAAKIRNGAVTASKIGAGAVGSTQLADGGVRSADLGGGVVTTGKLKDGGVTSDKLAANAVTNPKLAADSVATGKLQDGAVNAAKLNAGLLAQLVKDVSYVTATSPTDSVSPKSITASCPTGKVAIGGGSKVVFDTAIDVAVTGSEPTAADSAGKRTGWVASAKEIDGDDLGNWAVEAYAVCAAL
ncbi:MAG TPA: hypothetical protein VHF50_07940 [Solirubrobacterales bacterium]|nr:hypothetical protein [Solirubrobacterales bacterium]